MAVERNIWIICDTCDKRVGPFPFADHGFKQVGEDGWKIGRFHTCIDCVKVAEAAKEKNQEADAA